MTPILLAALAAGMVSTVNPCGFAMLPAYLGYFLGETEDRRTGRAGTVAISVAAGFLTVFTVAGLLLAAGVRALIGALPWLALVVGIGLVLAGVSQLLGKRLVPYLEGPSRASKKNSPAGMFMFGVSYAVASLSCTLPIFLTLVAGAIASASTFEAVAVFTAYGLGMALVVAGTTAAVAAGKRAIVDRLRPLAARLDRISGWVMTGAGLFIVWYWATSLVVGASALGRSGVVRRMDEWSSSATRFIGERPLTVALVVVAAMVLGRLRAKDEEPRTKNEERRTKDEPRGPAPPFRPAGYGSTSPGRRGRRGRSRGTSR